MKISILIVTFNHEKYIAKAIDGLLLQKGHPECEIIVCDDCSTDNTVSIASEKLKHMANVQIFSNKNNLGITRNYKEAFSRCKGEYIFIVEGDDYWIHPFKLRNQVEFLENNPMITMCAHAYYSQKEELGIFSAPPGSKEEITIFDAKDLILNYGIISNFSTCCYRRSELEKIPAEVYDVISFEWMINISVGHFGQLAKINTPMSVYRISASGAWSGTSHVEQLKGIINIIPAYNRILGYKYDGYFKTKTEMINEEIRLLGRSKSAKIYRLLRSAILRFFRKRSGN